MPCPPNIFVCGLSLSFNGYIVTPTLDDSFYIPQIISETADINFQISIGLGEFAFERVLFKDNGLAWFACNTGTGVAIYDRMNELYCVMYADPCWEKNIVYLKTEQNAFSTIKTLSEIAFRNRLLFYGGLVLHASAISYEGNGIAFTAPSGGGKTTQANLWKDNLDAKILNADRPALTLENGAVFIHGTPWNGSSTESVNAKAPLKIIAVIEKSSRNSLRILSRAEAVQYLLPRIFLPYFDQHLMQMALTNLEEILKRVPICLLECTPGREAVELVRMAVQ